MHWYLFAWYTIANLKSLGQCAPLANNVGGGSRSNSPFNNRYENNY
jgi:hypothetical protein